jgi:hypothetical protein
MGFVERYAEEGVCKIVSTVCGEEIMPGFIKTPADEARWSKAKSAANKTLSESAGDSYWALVNSIYQKMTKSDDEERLEAILLKARRRLSDEPEEDPEDVSPEEAGMREFDPEEEGDDADKWLEEHDPKSEDEEPGEGEESDDYDEYGPDEDEEPIEQDEGPSADETEAGEPEGDPAKVEEAPQAATQEAPVSGGRFPQPSREDIAEMRQYTRPWEQRAREKTRLEAEPQKNPVLHHEGKMLEAKNVSHKQHQDAYAAMQSSPEYQNADPITQMEMDSKFESDFHKQNPEYLANAAKAHGEAHKKGLEAKDIHASAKDEAIRHVLSGGAQAETPMSTEEALQHAGGTKGEEGTVGSMTQDPSSSFAAGNKAFLEQYAKDYAKKAKKPKDLNEMMNYDEGSKADVQRVLGEHPALKDPAKKAKVDAFFAKYHPLIGMNAQKVLNKLGLDSKRGDIDLGMLHEAGMHGLMQSINDYNHDHPSQASFSTHASNKIRGLQQTALRTQDQIPQELRVGAKKFQQGQAAPVVKPDLKSLVTKHPPEVADRMKRIDTFKNIQAPKAPKPEGGNE